MLGTFGGALEARKIDAGSGNLVAQVRGETFSASLFSVPFVTSPSSVTVFPSTLNASQSKSV